MSLHERFLQSGLRERGGRITESILGEIVVGSSKSDDNSWYYGICDVMTAYHKLNLDTYDKIAVLAYLAEKHGKTRGNVGGLDGMICEMLLKE